MTGKFIVLEGPDYCGKGTQHRLLVDYLMNHPDDRDKKSISVIATREPYDAPGIQKVHSTFTEIRRMLKTSKDQKADAQNLADLFVQNRKYHVAYLIRPMLDLGHIVVCDRYKYSTEAYQSAQELDINKLRKMHNGMPVPDMTFFIEAPVAERMRRKAKDSQRSFEEVFEKSSGFQELLDKQYELLAGLCEAAGERIIHVNGNRPVNEVFKEIADHVDALLYADS